MRVDQVLYPALIRYRQALSELEKAAPLPESESILKVLLARDAVQVALQGLDNLPASLLLELAELDRRLGQQQVKLTEEKNYPLWRNSFQPRTAD